MKDFITEAWLRANHTLSEGAEIHLPADARLTPSARELLESRRLRIKFLDEQGSLFVDDDAQQPQPVHGLTSSDTHPQACCELCRQPVRKTGHPDPSDGGKNGRQKRSAAGLSRRPRRHHRPGGMAANRTGGALAALAGGYPLAPGQHYARRRRG
jgi:hypothetical protein